MSKEEIDKLLRRYRVDTLEGLVEAQAREVKRLNEELHQSENDNRHAVADAVAEARHVDRTGDPYGTY